MKEVYVIFIIKETYENNRTDYKVIGPFSHDSNVSYTFNINGYKTEEEAEEALRNAHTYNSAFIAKRYEW